MGGNAFNKLYEGGLAVPGVVPIYAENVIPTLEDISKKILQRFFNLKSGQYAILGSGGKKMIGTTSGDIDIAIDSNEIAKNLKVDKSEVGNSIVAIIKQAYPKMELHYMKGFGIVSIAYPIKGGNGNVQVDLVMTDDIRFAEWLFWSPDFTKNESEWKGLYRTELIKSICAAVPLAEFTEYYDEELEGQFKGSLKKLGRNLISPTEGYQQTIKSFVGKKGQPVKSGTTEFTNFLSKDPEFITKSLLGDHAKVSDTNSFETVWKAMNHKDFPYKDYTSDIIKYFLEILNTKQLPIPKELSVYEGFEPLEKFKFRQLLWQE